MQLGTYNRHLNLLINSVIFIDLYLIIKNPFVPRELRMKWYLLFITTIMLLLIILSEVLNDSVKE